MHQMTVVGNDFVEQHLFAAVVPGRKTHLKHESVGVLEGGLHGRCLVHHDVGPSAGRRVPPHVPQKQNDHECNGGHGHGDSSAAPLGSGRCCARFQLTLTC